MMDFTVKIYKELLKSLISQNYAFQTFDEYISNPSEKAIILRHDVDLKPQNSLAFARIQNKLGIRGVYYFRAVAESWDEEVINEIHSLGHEIGYHYESLTTCSGNFQEAIDDFADNLTCLRRLAPVSTICMHGSPLSKYDSKDLWKIYDYRDFGVVGEPYFDVNFNKVFYMTDTGRKWDGEKVSVRDKVETVFKLSFTSTNQLIKASNHNQLPNQIMFTFHPQRWSDNKCSWMKEYLLQNIKNMIKRVLIITLRVK